MSTHILQSEGSGMTGSNPIADALDNPQAAPDLAMPGDMGPERDALEDYPQFPPSCPIKVLGNQQDISGKQTMFYLNWNGQLVGLEAGNRHGKLGLAALFGPSLGWLEANYPKFSDEKKEYDKDAKKWVVVVPARIVGFDQAKAAEALVIEGTRRGIFDPAGRMRGRGAHRVGEHGLALHCGDKVLVSVHKANGSIKGWHWTEPGLYSDMVYPASAPIPRPWHDEVDTRPGEKLLALLRTWNWKRPLLDARFALGFATLAPFGGAAHWRSNIWITGGRGTGKSALNGPDGVYAGLFGTGMFRTGNASSAAIRQSLKNSTVPVILDEAEASEDNRRIHEVVELARVSSSGDVMHRGGQDHTAHEFTLRSCFMFSSISIPPMQPQDRSRLAILELKPLAKDAPKLDLPGRGLPAIGRALSRRMVDNWHRFEATKNKFHDGLALVGHDSRACDQFAGLLAAADIALNDWDTADGLPDEEEIDIWVSQCRPDRMAEVNEAQAEEEACMAHITTSIVQARGGDEREALGSWIGMAFDAVARPLLTDADTRGKYARRLQEIGLKLVEPTRTEKGAWGAKAYGDDLEVPAYLAVASTHQGLAGIFGGTKWQGGVWRQSLARTEGAIDGAKLKFGHASLRAVLVPLYAVLDDSELNAASRKDAALAWVKAQLDPSEAAA